MSSMRSSNANYLAQSQGNQDKNPLSFSHLSIIVDGVEQEVKKTVVVKAPLKNFRALEKKKRRRASCELLSLAEPNSMQMMIQ